jgi:MiaB/RimO family radical SAM methylthiotransferase
MMRFFLCTLGCKVNQYETQVIREAWEDLGHRCVSEPKQAQVILVHSCAVTQKALTDLRKAVVALHCAAPEAPIWISGCAAQTHAPELSRLDGVTRVLGLAHRRQLWVGPEALLIDQAEKPLSALRPLGLEGIRDFGRARAQIKIQDGCAHGCTYCIVPLARGPHQSRTPKSVVEEVGRLLAVGFRELSLIGINLRLYGQDLDPSIDLWDLICLLERTFATHWAGRARFRLSSLDPAMLEAKALDTLAASQMLCPHLHLSLQSGSTEVLQRMGRGHYTPENIVSFCEELTRAWPLFALGVDLLTGFPGERDAHFQETLECCSALPLSYAHVFPYSPRPGTLAAGWPDQVPEGLRRKRAAALRALARDKKNVFVRSLLDLPELRMVVEGLNPVYGKCEYYIDCQVQPGEREVSPKSLLCVRPQQAVSARIICEFKCEDRVRT